MGQTHLGEFGLIDQLKRIFPKKRKETVVGIGDDCAVLDFGLREYILICSDSICDGVHFIYNNSKRHLIGRKAAGSVLSDIASMGGWPISLNIDIGIPGYIKPRDVTHIAEGIEFLCDIFNVDVAGGDISKAEQLWISTKAIGMVEKDKLTLRSSAQINDHIWISGPLGGSRYGRHLEVNPRIPEARWLVQNFKINSMIDITDGLVADLYHILEASQKSGEIDMFLIPLHKDAKDQEEALYMGEDFELLFTMPEPESLRLMQTNCPYKFYCIGQIIDGPGNILYARKKDGTTAPIENKGFRHF